MLRAIRLKPRTLLYNLDAMLSALETRRNANCGNMLIAEFLLIS